MDGSWYDRTAAKKPTNLTLNQDLVTKARALGGSLSERVERLLAAEIEAEARRQASLDSAIESSNELIATHGLFGDDHNDGRFA